MSHTIKVELKSPAKPGYICQFPPLVPLRITGFKPNHVGGNGVREEAVKDYCHVGDVCYGIEESGLRVSRIFHCPSGKLLTSWYGEYILFERAEDVERIVLAKPGN